MNKWKEFIKVKEEEFIIAMDNRNVGDKFTVTGEKMKKKRIGELNASIEELRAKADELEKEGGTYPTPEIKQTHGWCIRIETTGDHYDDTWQFVKVKK